jgi:hypothetical protein
VYDAKEGSEDGAKRREEREKGFSWLREVCKGVRV